MDTVGCNINLDVISYSFFYQSKIYIFHFFQSIILLIELQFLW